jgi:hypothetical protein
MQTVTPSSIDGDLVAWFIRMVLAALIALGGWVIRDAAKTLKETHLEQATIKARLDAHDVMFEAWLTEMVERGEPATEVGHINKGRRKSDEVIRQLLERRTR